MPRVRTICLVLAATVACLAPRSVAIPAEAASPAACSLPQTLALPGGAKAQDMALDSSAHVLIVATPAGLDLLDSCTGAVIAARISTGGVPTQVEVDSNAGRAAVLLEEQARVRLFDTRKRRWLPDVHLQADAAPKQIAMAGGTHEVLILDPGNATLWVADTMSGTVRHHVSNLPGTQEAVAIDAEHHRAYVASAGTNTVSVIDSNRWQVARTTKVGRWPLALGVSSRTMRVFVANRDGMNISMLDGTSGALVRTVPLPRPPQALSVNELLKRVYVVVRGTGKSLPGPSIVLDAATGSMTASRRAAPSGPALAVDPGTGTVFYLDATTGMIKVLLAMPTTTARPTSTPAPKATKRSTPGHTPTPRRTSTPTSTRTPVPPTSTALPPTSTPVPPTSTLTATPTSTPTLVPTATDTPTPTPSPSPSPTATVIPTATPTPLPSFSIFPSSTPDKPVALDTDGSLSFTIVNDGPGSLKNIDFAVSSRFFSAGSISCQNPLAPGASCTFEVSSRITCGGSLSTVTITADAANSPRVLLVTTSPCS